MESNGKRIKIGIILIGTTLILCLSANHYLSLEKPVFFQHYYEVPIPITTEQIPKDAFLLQYITNSNDSRQVTGITFQEAPELYLFVNEYPHSSEFTFYSSNDNEMGRRVGRYSIRSFYVTTSSHAMDQLKDGLTLSNAVISFHNGDQLETKIGKIIYYKQSNPASQIQHHGRSYGPDGITDSEYSLKKDMTISEIYSPLYEEMKDNITIQFDGEEINLEKRYKLGTKVIIKTSPKFSGNVSEKFKLWDIRPLISYRDKKGKSFKERLSQINSYYQNQNTMDVLKYLIDREGF